MRVLVYGLGRSGLAAAALLARQGHEVVAYDQRPKPEEVARLEALGGRMTGAPTSAAAEICVAAPGVPFDHPDLAALRRSGVETIGEVEWVYRSVTAPIIGVTGTAGKTSVTRWLCELLQGAGLAAVAGGNVDPALSQIAREGHWLVTELSSFQLERCPTLKPRVAVALNLGVDHLDRHGSLSAYHSAKYAITANQDEDDLLILNADDPNLAAWALRTRARLARFSLSGPADAHLAGETLMLHGEPLVEAGELAVSGRHQLGNALAVALAAHELGVPREALRAGLSAFRGVPGRFAAVARLGGITFVEDSIATRTLAVQAALAAAEAPVVWLAGGQDKGAELAPLRELVREKVSLMIGLGAAGARFCAAFADLTETRLVTLEEGEAALRAACEVGLEHLRPVGRGTVLLAPLGASFDQFRDYRARADAFRRAALELCAPTEPGSEEATWIRS